MPRAPHRNLRPTFPLPRYTRSRQFVDLAVLCAGEVRELEIKSVIELLHRGLATTETGGRNNCLGYAICGELMRITTHHQIVWPGEFPRDGNDVRTYLWDHMRECPTRWGCKTRAHCNRVEQMVHADQGESLQTLSDAELMDRLYKHTRDTTVFLSEFEALVAAELLAADGVQLVLAHRPDKGNFLQRWDASWVNRTGQNVGLWRHTAPGDIKCTTAVICNAEPGVHWE